MAIHERCVRRSRSALTIRLPEISPSWAVLGSTLALGCLVLLLATGDGYWLLVGLLCGYGFAWIGHFGFEKNKPASFSRPLYSFRGDWVMYRDIWLGKIKI